MTDAGNAMMAALPSGDHLNYTAILACGALNFVVGGLWYSGYGFAKAWMKAAKVTPRKLSTSNANMGLLYTGWIAMSFLVALSMGYLLMLTHAADASSALRAAWTVWIGFTVAAGMGDYLALGRGMKLFAINMGQHFVTFTLNALILSAWR
jgi:hypothetical protein